MSVSDTLVRKGVDTLDAEFAVVDSEGTIVYTNSAWQEFAVDGGFPGDPAMTGMNYFEVCRAARDADEYAEAACDGLDAIVQGDQKTFSLEYPCPGPGESFRWFLMWASGFTFEGDDYVVVEHLDITDRKVVERDLRAQNQRLAGLASILSHDLRNPLNIASGYAELLAADVGGKEVDRILTALERMDAIIDDALTLARQTTLENLESVDLDACARRAWETVVTDEATLTVEASRTVRADESLLRTAFENLFRNSVEHAGTDVSIRVGLVDDGFFVADDGPGIPADVRDQVFEPGFTTNSTGKNTGLGLAIVESVSDAHGWTVEIGDGEADGARFEFRGVEPVERDG